MIASWWKGRSSRKLFVCRRIVVPLSGVAAAAAFVGSLGGPAGAEPTAAAWMAKSARGFYTTTSAGAYWPQPVTFTETSLGPLLPIQGRVQGDAGFASELGLGHDFGRWRSELTLVRRRGVVESSTWQVGARLLPTPDDHPPLRSNSVFASLYLDLPVPETRLVPYVGGGFGYTALYSEPTTFQLGPNRVSIGGGNKGLLGYQAKAGLAYRSSPRTDVFAEGVLQGSPARTQDSLHRSALTSWGLRLGLRVRLGKV